MSSLIAISVDLSGLPTPTCKLFADGSDTVIETVTLTEATNRKGWYTGTTTTTATGLYMIVIYTGSDSLGNMWVRLTNSSPTEDVAAEDRYMAAASVSASADIDVGATAGTDLQTSFAAIYRALGRFLFSEPDSTAWTVEQTQTVGDVVHSGLRMFYWPVVEGELYEWSFLKKTGTITTSAGDDEYDLPADFGGSIETMMHAAGEGRRRLSRVGETELLSWRSADAASGVPQYFAVSAVQPVAGSATSYEVLLYPKPDKAYSLVYRYGICPDLDGATVHLGNATHSEAVLEACLAAAEKAIRPELVQGGPGGPGVHQQRFEQLLAAAIASDRGLQ